MHLKRIIPLLLLSVLETSHAQDLMPLNHFLWQQTEQQLQASHSPVFTSLKPLQETLYVYKNAFILDTVNPPGKKSWLYRKLFLEHFYSLESGELSFNLDPTGWIEFGKERGNDSWIYRNTREFHLNAKSFDRLTFSASFYENQARFPAYVKQYMTGGHGVPGQGYPKSFGTDAYDFAWSEGHVSVLVFQGMIAELGYGKSFFGDGYRSLLLSDFAFVYPYLGYRYYFSHFYLATRVASFIEPSRRTGGLRGDDRKTATFHMAGYRNNWMELALCEINVYNNPDSAKKFRWEPTLFNPVPLLNTFASQGSSLMGLNLKLIPFQRFQVYGQLALQDPDFAKPFGGGSRTNKMGLQLGGKYFDAFGLHYLYLQAEYNQAAPYLYAEANPVEAFSQYNEPLAHPLGANFKEIVGILSYRPTHWFLSGITSMARTGRDASGLNQGSNILLSTNLASGGTDYYGNFIGQGISTTILNAQLSLGWVVNPKNHLELSINYHLRNESSIRVDNISHYLNISLRTNLNNFYFDF